jgi:5'-methylthioadenosine phosphorylase
VHGSSHRIGERPQLPHEVKYQSVRTPRAATTRIPATIATLRRLLPRWAGGAARALDTALVTAPEARDQALLKKLDAVAGRVLKG